MKKSDNSDRQIRYPYARPKAMEKFMDAVRGSDWRPPRIDLDLMQTLGIAPSKESETLGALRFLGLVDEKGAPTAEFDQLRQDYRSTMERLVREKYVLLFQLIPAKLITQKSVVNFFTRAGYVEDTAEYQGALFGWFCRQAGIEFPNLPEKFHRARFDKKDRERREEENN